MCVKPLIKDVKVKSTRWLREKECFVQVTLSLPEVMWDNLSFAFQALWGHLGWALFQDRGGPCWGHPLGLILRTLAICTRIISHPRSPSPTVLFPCLNASQQGNTHVITMFRWKDLYLQADRNYADEGKTSVNANNGYLP